MQFAAGSVAIDPRSSVGEAEGIDSITTLGRATSADQTKCFLQQLREGFDGCWQMQCLSGSRAAPLHFPGASGTNGPADADVAFP
jgi:hypothetical protein